MIVPGIAPMYVRRWPRISDSSRTPPTEMRANFRPRARAIDLPSEVLPTPGGPTKQRIGPERSFFSFETARYSMIRSFTLSRSKWSSSRISRARSRSRWSSVCSVHGTERIQSRYVRMTPYSAAAGGSFSSRESSRLAALSAVLRQVLRLDLLAELVDLRLLPVALAELVLDRLQLLAEEELALALVDLARDLGLDLRSELRHLELAAQDQRHGAQPLLDVQKLEELLPLLRLQAQRRRDEVAERARIVDVGGRQLQLLGQVRRHPDHAPELVLDVPGQRLDLGRVREDVRKLLELGGEVGLGLLWLDEAHAVEPLDEDPQRAVGHLDHLVDDRGRADRRRARPSPAPRPPASRTAKRASIRSPETTSSISRTERSWPTASGVIDSGKTTVSFSGRTGRLSCSVGRFGSTPRSSAPADRDRDRLRAARRRACDRQRDPQQPALVRRASRRVRRRRRGRAGSALERPVVDLGLLVDLARDARPAPLARDRQRALARPRSRSIRGRRRRARRRRRAPAGPSVRKQSTAGRKPRARPVKRGTCHRSAKSSSISPCRRSMSRRGMGASYPPSYDPTHDARPPDPEGARRRARLRRLRLVRGRAQRGA